MNEKLTRWFDEGHAKEALLGGEPHFVPEITYRDRHDRVLVVDQLLLWAANNPGRQSEATAALREALDTAVADRDVWAAYDLAWSYLLVVRDHGTAAPVDRAGILNALDKLDAIADVPADGIELRRRVRDELSTHR